MDVAIGGIIETDSAGVARPAGDVEINPSFETDVANSGGLDRGALPLLSSKTVIDLSV